MTAGTRLRLAVLGAFTLLGLIEATKAYVSVQARGIPIPWWETVGGNLPWWYLWAAFTPLIVAAAKRLPLRQPWTTAVAFHVALAVAMAALHSVIMGAYYWHFAGRMFTADVPQQVRRFLDNYLLLNVVTYWAILVAFHALDLYRSLRAREVAAAQVETELTAARLEALRRELNPHFLFNALNTVAGLIRDGTPGQAVDVVARLGDLLRVTLERSMPQRITISRELHYLNLYVEIERTRFRDRLSIEYDIADDVRDALVPTFVLQPIVENAVRHAVARTIGRASITVRASRRNGDTVLDITDNGPGFPIEVLEGREFGVGLSNARDRLGAMYGDDAAIRVENLPGCGARVRIELPYEIASDSSPTAAPRPP